MDDYTLKSGQQPIQNFVEAQFSDDHVARVTIAEKITSCINVSVFMICLTAIILALLLR